jgi:2'-5' RNA ligase
MGEIRAFIAIELPSEIKSELALVQKKLKREAHPSVKWVSLDGIHITLKFLGNINPAMTSQIMEAISRAARGMHPFNLELQGLGAFPNLRRPRVIWVGMGGEISKLTALQKNVDLALTPLGFLPETRSFTPHLTLARLTERTPVQERGRLGQLAAEIKIERYIPFQADSIHLIRSELTPAGAIYSYLGSAKLDTS